MRNPPRIHPCLWALAAVLILLAAGCTQSGPRYQIHKLPSGKEVRILGMYKMFFSNDDPALMLKYETDIQLSDAAALQKEVEEIWDVFQVDVEKAGLSTGILQASTPQTGSFIKVSRSRNFVVQKNLKGIWEFAKDGEKGEEALPQT